MQRIAKDLIDLAKDLTAAGEAISEKEAKMIEDIEDNRTDYKGKSLDKSTTRAVLKYDKRTLSRLIKKGLVKEMGKDVISRNGYAKFDRKRYSITAAELYDPKVVIKAKTMWRDILSNIDGEFYSTAASSARNLRSLLEWDFQTDNDSDLKKKNEAMKHLEAMANMLFRKVQSDIAFSNELRKPLKSISGNLKKIL